MNFNMLMETEMVLRGFGYVLAGTPYNMGFTAHFVRPNSAFGGISYSPVPLYEMAAKMLTIKNGGK
jgi:hypothetical protein